MNKSYPIGEFDYKEPSKEERDAAIAEIANFPIALESYLEEANLQWENQYREGGWTAVELLTASQAIHFREPLKTSPFLESILMAFRAEVPIVEQDRILHQDIDKAKQFLMNLEVDPELL